MEPRIEMLNEKKLIGKKLRMSFASNKTQELWKSFAPRKNEIKNLISSDLYSVDIYGDTNFFIDFSPHKEFEKWAAVEVKNFDDVPVEMDKLVIPRGQYAVFQYKGKPSEAQKTFQYIYGVWLPGSVYVFDDRPYFALMGEKYKGEDPNSEEEFWIPVMNK